MMPSNGFVSKAKLGFYGGVFAAKEVCSCFVSAHRMSEVLPITAG